MMDHEATARKLFHEIQCDDEVYSVRKIAAALAEAEKERIELAQTLNQLQNENATLREAQQTANELRQQAEAERDAAYVRCSDIANEIANRLTRKGEQGDSVAAEVRDAIAAEIAKAGKP